jgi:glutamate-1-semialdehyde 2,1-aminomutase
MPDLTTLGKIIGGGLPVGAYGGRKEIMAHMAPQGPVYQAGTLSGNPVAMAAGIATLKEIAHPHFYDALDEKAGRLEDGLKQALDDSGVPGTVGRVGSMLGMFFSPNTVFNYEDAKTSDLDKFARYYQLMLSKGIYLAPSQFEALFVSSAHNLEHIETTIKAAAEAISEL